MLYLMLYRNKYSRFKMQAYENQIEQIKIKIFLHVIDLYTYQKNCETFCHTATLLIHNLKYLTVVSYCFTKGKKHGRV